MTTTIGTSPVRPAPQQGVVDRESTIAGQHERGAHCLVARGRSQAMRISLLSLNNT
jgi:hypothetical protein